MLSDSETVVAGIFVTVVIAVIIVVIVIVLAATRPSPPTETSLASRYVGYIHNPKRIHVTPKELILGKVPLGWNWYDIGQEQKEWFEDKWSGQIKLNETKYTTPVMNQHMPLYCGSCYLMAAVQMVADRFWIKTGKKRILDVQDALNRYNNHPEGQLGWNSCMGGHPNDFLDYINSRGGLFEEHKDNVYKATVTSCNTPSNKVGFRFNVYDLSGHSNESIKRRIACYGPVLIAVDATSLMSKKFRRNPKVQICNDPAKVDHIVCVAGWKDNYWIVRNTWGIDQDNNRPPSDFECLAEAECNGKSARCANTKKFKWQGLKEQPGYYLMSQDCTNETTTQWFDAIPYGWPEQ